MEMNSKLPPDGFRMTPAISCLFSTKINSLDFQSSYNDQQVAKILGEVNVRSEAELYQFNISKQRIKKIELWKQKHGVFTSIEDILELDGFGVKVLEKFCDSILNSPAKSDEGEKKSEDGKLSKKKPQFVSPILVEGFRKSITSCVSLHLDINYIAWTKLSLSPQTPSNNEVLPVISVDEWMCFEFGNDEKKRSLSDLIQILIYLNGKIPHADTYVVEAQQVAQPAKQPGSPLHININVQKAQFLAMVSMLLALRAGKGFDVEMDSMEEKEKKKRLKQQQQVFFLRTFLASRLYRTFVGNERVSAEAAIENILRYNNNKDQPKNVQFSFIDVPLELRKFYDSSSKIDRDYMGHSMLIGLCFIKLCVLKCAQSMAMLNKRSN